MPKHRKAGAFTLIEMLVTLLLVGVLTGLGFVVISQSRAKARAVTCLRNQQHIAEGLVAYYTDHTAFPADGASANLAMAMDPYIPWPEGSRASALPAVWRCPNDGSGPLINSYEPYYVQRKSPDSSEFFVLGCPRHKETGSGCVNIRGLNTVQTTQAGRVTINDNNADVAGNADQRTLSAGTMRFEDGSTATVTESESGYGVTVLASFRNEDGKLYTLVRVQGKGKTDFSVTPGSRFEVITPVAIIGVRGTKFTTETQTTYTKVSCTESRVWVLDRNKGATHELDQGETVKVVGTTPTTPQDQPLSLAYVGSGKWDITNPNNYDVSFTWHIYWTCYCGTRTAQAGTTTRFTSRNIYPQTLIVTYTLPNLGTQTITKTTP